LICSKTAKLYRLTTTTMSTESILSSAAFSSSLDTSSRSTGTNSFSSCYSIEKKLRFDHVAIRDMPIELGEHPQAHGPPLTIGWEPQETRHMTVDVYELIKNRRSGNNLKIPKADRADMLVRAGYSVNEIIAAVEQCNAVCKQREASQRGQKWEMFIVVKERAARALKKSIPGSPAA
jgi:hypothetical protein